MAAGAEVSSTVVAIIAAFTSCREVFKKFRQKRSLRKGQAGQEEAQELELSKSLRRGTVEIEQEYTQGVQAFGSRFAAGDAEAQHLLTKTLLRLNTGLVEIISTFLTSKDPTKLRLDYGALASISNSSRVETKASLLNLQQRLLAPPVSRAPAARCGWCGGSGHADCQPKETRHAQRSGRAVKTTGGRVAYVPVGDSKQKQLALIRPRPGARRSESSSSASSSLSNASSNASPPSTCLTTPSSTPPVSPRAGQQAPNTRNAAQKPSGPKFGHRVLPLRLGQGNAAAKKSALAAAAAAIPRPRTAPPMPARAPIAAPQPVPRPAAAAAAPHNAHALWPAPRARSPPRPESFYSFASESTRLGEIPAHRLLAPPDLQEMQRLNAEAEARGWDGAPGLALAAHARRQRDGGKRAGLLARMFRGKAPARLDSVAEA